MVILLVVFAILVLFVLSALFSASETAVFSMPTSKRLKLEENRKIKIMFNNQDIILASILTGNLIVNVMISSLGTLLFIYISEASRMPREIILPLGAILIVLLLLLFGEITPKIIAVRNPTQVFKIAFPVIYTVFYVFRPLVIPLGFITRRLFKPKEVFPTEGDIHAMVNIARKLHVIKEDEEEIMENLLHLGKMTVKEIMTPRVKMIAFDEKILIGEAVSLIKRTKKSRYPVYRENIDNITGIVYTKDIIISEENKRLKDISREVLFVPETKKLIELLEEFRKGEQHIAIVVDEFGGTSGLITLEDILEVIFGEIADEYDIHVEEPYKKISKDTYVFEGDVDMLKVKKVFSGAFDDVECERLSEFILEKLGKIPKRGDRFIYNGVEITVKNMKKQAIDKVMLKKV